jgi:putative heme-binding domain-containing protein
LLERFNDPESANRATSACGLGIYRDTWLGEEFAGNAFTCEPVHNLVHREIISPNAAFTAHRAADEKESEFLASTDNWFRPVQARPGPDGALYVVDMYRFLIEHPRWIPAARLAQIDVRAGADKGRIYRVVKKGAELRPISNLKKMNSEALAAALDNVNGIERDRVHVEILTRHDKGVIPGLVRVANESKLPQARAQALSILDGISALEPNMIQAALKNPDAGVRQIAIRLTEPYLAGERKGGKELLKTLVEMTNDPSILVLRQLAFSLGESRDVEAGKVLAALATKWVGNSELRTAILSSSKPHATVVLNAIVNLPAETTGRTEWITPLIATVVDSADRKAIAAAVQMTLPEANHKYNAGKISMLASLLDALDDKKLKVDDFFARGSQDRARLESAISKAAQIASDENAPIKTRQSAISLLGRGESQAELDRLASFAMSGSQELRRAAITAFKKEHSPKVAETLLQNWRQASPTARNEIVSSLLMDREEWTVALLHAVKDGVVTANEISLSDRQRLSESPKSQIKELAIEVLPAMNKGAREDIVNQYKGALTLQGNVTRGAKVFTRNCSTCHLVNGVGHEVGPDLAALRSKDPEYWIKNILDPNAVVEPRFVNYSIELNDDRSLGGLIRGETANSLTIVAGGGVTENVQRSQIKDIRASSLSLMPEGLEQGINVQEMADLVAFLKSGNPRKTVPGNQPELIVAANAATVLLPAAKAEIYGEQITFEDTFGNIGMWHGTDDLVVWTVNVAQPASYDVYLDYACAGNSAGNRFAVVAGDQKITGAVSATGGDWSEYKQIRVGQMNLPSGTIRVELRPDAPLKGALMDLRTVALAPKGKKPQWPKAVAPVTDETVLRDPPSVARFILDPKQSNTARENAVNANPQFAGALIREMTADLKPGSAEEYQRIPWIWRVAITCGKRNDAGQIADVLKVSLPHEGEPLRDWQAVVIGGGIINGISQRGEWPLERINEILQDHPELKKRWDRSLDLAATMTDDEKVPSGTRYDALRMIALLPWEKSGEQLRRYLGDENGELQMGAVSGLADVQNREATASLVQSFARLEKGNRDLAFNGLLRSDERRQALKSAVGSGKLSKDLLTTEQLKELE